MMSSEGERRSPKPGEVVWWSRVAQDAAEAGFPPERSEETEFDPKVRAWPIDRFLLVLFGGVVLFLVLSAVLDWIFRPVFF